MIELTPQKRFLENEEGVKYFRSIVDSNQFHSILTLALAEYSLRNFPSSEELQGAKAYISVLLNFAETPQPVPQYPIKRVQIIEDTRQHTIKPK